MTIVIIKAEVTVAALDSAAQLIYMSEHRDVPPKERTPWHMEKPEVRQWYRVAAIENYEEALAQFHVTSVVAQPVLSSEAPANEG